MNYRDDSYRISRKQRIIMETLHERQHKLGERIDYWDLREILRAKLGIEQATRHFTSSLSRSIKNLHDKSWICSYRYRPGSGRGYTILIYDMQITQFGIAALKNRAPR